MRYDIDFKRFGAFTSLYATSNLSRWIYKPIDGVALLFPPKQTSGMEVSIVNRLLQPKSIEDLKMIAANEPIPFSRNEYSEDQDIQKLLKNARCDKNCLFFHTDYIFSNADYSIDSILRCVESH